MNSHCFGFSTPIRISNLKKGRKVKGNEKPNLRTPNKVHELSVPVALTIAVGYFVTIDPAHASTAQNVLEGIHAPILADVNVRDWLGNFLHSANQAFGFGKSRTQIISNTVAFALGLATMQALLGIAASFAGKAYSQVGQGLPIAASVLALVMGLNLLEVIEIQLPSFFDNFDPRATAANFPSSVQAYLAGLTFALAASPCSTPMLATLLGYVAASRDLIIGGSLLLTYTTGYVAPFLVVASFASALQSLLSFRKFLAWINPMRYGIT